MTPDRRPAFARDFPRTPALDAAVDAFARGDYATARSAARDLERTADDDTVKRCARTLVDRTEADPLAVVLLALAALLLLVVGGWWVVHSSAPR